MDPLSVTASLQITTKLFVFTILLLLLCTACLNKNNPLERVKATGVLRIAMDPSFAPFAYINDENELVGYDVELAWKIAGALGVEPQFISTGYDALYDALTVNQADIIISALYPDPYRTQTFEFSQSYFNAGDVLIVADHTINSWKALSGKRIACIFGTAGHMTVLSWQESISPPPIMITTSDPFTYTDGLIDGELDAVVVDHVAALNITQNTTGVHILPEMITDEPYVIAGRIEDKALIDVIDEILIELTENGTLEQLSRKWMLIQQ